MHGGRVEVVRQLSVSRLLLRTRVRCCLLRNSRLTLEFSHLATPHLDL